MPGRAVGRRESQRRSLDSPGHQPFLPDGSPGGQTAEKQESLSG